MPSGRHPIRLIALLLVAGLITAGCGNPFDGKPARPETSEPVLSQPESNAPAPEGSGPERPAQTPQSQPSVSLPGLPVGSNDNSTGDSLEPHCVRVRWLGPDIPSGFTIAITGVEVTPPGLFKFGSPGSCRSPACKQTGKTFSFHSEDDECFVTVIPQRYAPDDGSLDAELVLNGLIVCPHGKEAACSRFAEEAREDDESLPLFLPHAP